MASAVKAATSASSLVFIGAPLAGQTSQPFNRFRTRSGDRGGRVRAAVDDAGAVLVDSYPSALPPDSRESREVTLRVLRAVLVAPEEERHRGHRLRQDE